jgi:hypothetical protein
MKRLVLAIAVLTAATIACCKLPTTPTLPPVTLPAPAPTLGPQSAPTQAPTVPPVAEPTEAPTQPPIEVPTQPPTEAPTVPPLPPTEPPPPPPPAGLTILSFTVDVQELPPNGKRLTFQWQTTGATSATIWSGTSRRFPQAWDVPPNGTHTVELEGTLYRNPEMALMAYDAGGDYVSESVMVEWACEYDYFFAPAPAACPRYSASETWAAEQPFEHGRMIWLEEVQGADYVLQRFILVLYDDGTYAYFEDAWVEGMPESDPAIVPPAGLLQPIRGFGKVWRENTSVRDGLGWATAGEQGFTTTWQEQIAESIGQGKAFVLLFSDQVAQVNGWDVRTGTWEYLP